METRTTDLETEAREYRAARIRENREAEDDRWQEMLANRAKKAGEIARSLAGWEDYEPAVEVVEENDDAVARFEIDDLAFEVDWRGSHASWPGLSLLRVCARCGEAFARPLTNDLSYREEILWAIGSVLEDESVHKVGPPPGFCPRDLDEEGSVILLAEDDEETRQRKQNRWRPVPEPRSLDDQFLDAFRAFLWRNVGHPEV